MTNSKRTAQQNGQDAGDAEIARQDQASVAKSEAAAPSSLSASSLNLAPKKIEVMRRGFVQVREAHKSELIEDYVELIGDLAGEGGFAKQVQIANCLAVAQPTVAKMLKRLDEMGYVSIRRYHGVSLTDKGAKLARESRERHNIVRRFLESIGVDPATACVDAEGIEHHVSAQTLKAFAEFAQRRGAPGPTDGEGATAD